MLIVFSISDAKGSLITNDRDAKITKMKDERTHLAHKAEHAINSGDRRLSTSRYKAPTRATRPRWQQALPEAAAQLEAVDAPALPLVGRFLKLRRSPLSTLHLREWHSLKPTTVNLYVKRVIRTVQHADVGNC